MRQYLIDILPGFFRCASNGDEFVASARSVTCAGNKVFSYKTCIAALENGKMFINKEKYSTTTSHLQNSLRHLAMDFGFEIVDVEANDQRLRFNLGVIAA